MTKLILLEFNELCPFLLEKWIKENKLPNFARFYGKSDVFVATADDPNPDHWEPWIQWYSIHTGLSFRRHGVFHLTDGPNAGHPDVWRMLRQKGLTVANFGSMNARALNDPETFYLPDPWCTSELPYPAELSAFHRVVSGLVQENSTAGTRNLTAKDYARFVTFLFTHGLRPSTAIHIARQLWSDTIRRQPTAWKRVPLLDQLQFDIFRNYWLRYRPDFASFFVNSTAHYQHAYWHCLFPQDFSERPSPEEERRCGGAILFGYQQMDRLLARFFRLESRGARLILATALSQRASTAPNAYFYRPRDVAALLKTLEITPDSIEPVMAQQFMLRFRDSESVMAARNRLSGVAVNGQRVFDFGAQDEECTLFFGPGTHFNAPDDALVELPSGMRIKFYDLFYRLPHTKTGVHHPESVLWFKTGRHRVHEERVSILDILPTILDHFDLDSRGVDPRFPLEGGSLNGLLRA
jgi:hypothetical protein